jgi:hypothetical protein
MRHQTKTIIFNEGIKRRLAFEPSMGEKPMLCGVEAPSFPLLRVAAVG